MARGLRWQAKWISLFGLLLGCGTTLLPGRSQELGTQASPLLADGVFADANFTHWHLDMATNANGMLAVPPQSANDLNLVAAATPFSAQTYVVSGAAQSVLPHRASLANANLRLPFANSHVAAINVDGNQRHSSTLSQTFAFSESDRDPLDNRFRLRAIVAPVLGNAGPGGTPHMPSKQSYALLRLANAELQQDNVAQYYLAAGQQGVPWQYVTDAGSNQSQYLGWQLVELTPSILLAGVGQTMKVSLAAAGCAASGHFGTLYVDSVGSWALGDASVVVLGPEHVAPQGTVHYTVRLRQSAVLGDGNLQLKLAIPTDTTLASFVPPASWQCTVPATGAAGPIMCTIPQAAAGSLPFAEDVDLAVTVVANAESPIVLGSYALSAGSRPALWGPLVSTAIETDVSKLANLIVQVAPDPAATTASQVGAIVHISNAGPSAVSQARISSVLGQGLTAASWQCSAGAGADCGPTGQVAGTGALALAANFAAVGELTCRVALNKGGIDGDVAFGVAAAVNANMLDTTAADSEMVARLPLASATAGQEPGGAAQGSGKALGEACAQDAECQSSHCADGVCCDEACRAACSACNAPAALGTCTPYAAPYTEPKLGHLTCGPYACQGPSCGTACATDAACLSGLVCFEGVCRPPRGACQVDADCPNGRLCTPAKTCESAAIVDPTHPNWTLQGSGCQSAPATPEGALLLLVAALWRRRRCASKAGRGPRRERPVGRRRSHKGRRAMLAAIGLLLALAPGRMAGAAQTPSLATNGFAPLGGLDDIHSTAGVGRAPRYSVGARLWLNYAHRPLRIRTVLTPPISQDVITHQGTLDVGGGLVLPGRLELDVMLPAVLQQSSQALFVDASLTKHALRASLGDLRVTPKWRAFGGRHVGLGLAALLIAPTGRRHEFVSGGAFAVAPMAMLELLAPHGARLLLNAGYLFRPRRSLADLQVGRALRWSAAAELPWRFANAQTLTAAVSAFGESDLKRGHLGQMPIDVLGSLSFAFASGVGIELGGGTGLTNGYGAPRWRAALGLRFVRRPSVAPALAPPPPAAPAPVPAPVVVEAAVADRDHDGVPDDQDRCPDVPGGSGGQSPGCPTPRELKVALASLSLSHFANGSSALPPENDAVLEQVRQLMAQHPSLRLAIAGHTDNTGTPAKNQQLSQGRANSAKAWLAAHGIAKERITAAGFGARQPIVRGRTQRARAKNRRVVFRPIGLVVPQADGAPILRPFAPPGANKQQASGAGHAAKPGQPASVAPLAPGRAARAATRASPAQRQPAEPQPSAAPSGAGGPAAPTDEPRARLNKASKQLTPESWVRRPAQPRGAAQGQPTAPDGVAGEPDRGR